MFYTEFMKKICSKLKEMTQPKVDKMLAKKNSFTEKLLGSGESRVMFR